MARDVIYSTKITTRSSYEVVRESTNHSNAQLRSTSFSLVSTSKNSGSTDSVFVSKYKSFQV